MTKATHHGKINVTKSLSILEPAFISIYEVNAKKYIAINNFCKHQHPHAKEAKSALPAPPSTNPAPEIPGQATEKDSAKMPLTLNPYTITLNHNHNPETDCSGGGADGFLSGLVTLWNTDGTKNGEKNLDIESGIALWGNSGGDNRS